MRRVPAVLFDLALVIQAQGAAGRSAPSDQGNLGRLRGALPLDTCVTEW